MTPEHVVPQVVLSILHAKELGLRMPIIYNTSAFDSRASLELLDGLVDIYLPDFKVWEEGSGRRLLKAEGYAEAAKESIRTMHEQVGDLCFTPDGLAKKGVLVRHLVMPGYEEEGAKVMQWLASEDGLGKDAFVNVMEQYRPDAYVGKTKREKAKVEAGGDLRAGKEAVRYGDINRTIKLDELRSVKAAAQAAGLWRFPDPPQHGGWAV